MTARPGLPSFEYVRPNTVEEAVRLLGDSGGTARLLMGGTDLFVRMRDGVLRPETLIDVKGLPGMCELAYDAREGLRDC